METQPGTMHEAPKAENQKPEAPKTEAAKTEVVKEVHHYHHGRRGPGGMFFGMLVVAVGVYFFGRQAGWFPADAAFNWNWVWPLVIIAVGLSMLTRHGVWSWIISGIFTLGILFFLLAMVFGWTGSAPAQTTETVGIAQETSATSAVVSLTTGASKLTVRGGANQLVTGTYTHTGLTLEKSSTVSDSVQHVSLTTKGSWAWFGMHRNDLDLQLANDVPLTVNVDSGASDMNLNLTDIMAKAVDVDTGASSLVLTMGDKVDQSSVRVKAGASSITVSLPKTVGAKITLDAGATSKNLSDFTKLDDKTYESANYSSATKKIALDFDLGAASLTVNWR